MGRKQVLIAPLEMSGLGLEVAPYFNPLLTKAEYNVRYVDYVDNATLKAKAADNPGAKGRELPAIDWVWTPGKPLRSCIPDKITFDYAVASHVIEHVPNTIGWLNDILSVMKTGATLALAVPDRRRTMDYYRRETTLGDLVGNWLLAPSNPTPAQIMDFLSQSFYDNRTDGSPMIDVKSIPFEKAPRHYSDADALNFARWAHNEGKYLDTHCTVWTPESFVEVMGRVVGMGLLNVSLSDPFSDGVLDEFIIHMKKLGDPKVR